MTTKEFNQLVSDSPHRDILSAVKIPVTFNHLGIEREFIGVKKLYNFILEQVTGWDEIAKEIDIAAQDCPDFFRDQRDKIANLLSFLIAQSKEFINPDWNPIEVTQVVVDHLKRMGKSYLPSDSIEVKLLVELYKKQPILTQGAHDYFTNQIDRNSQFNKFYLRGILIAADFLNNEKGTRAYDFKGLQTSNFASIKNNFERRVSNAEKEAELKIETLTQQIESAETAFTEIKNKGNAEFSEVISAKTKEFSELVTRFLNDSGSIHNQFNADAEINLKKAVQGFDDFHNSSAQKVIELENTYKENLKLQGPAMYWKERAESLKKQGWNSFYWTMGLVFLAGGSLFTLLWISPDTIYSSFFSNDKSAAIRWSIVFITFISIIAVSIRATMKVMFSSFHLARDCEERYTLTYFYLSLLKDSNVDDKDRQLIMQSLFSRAETGLLKDDASPTMPNDFVTKIFK